LNLRPKDIQIVDVIHKKYSKLTTENAEKTKSAKLAEIDKWLNAQILEREAKLKQFDTDSKNAAELEKKEYGELTKPHKDSEISVGKRRQRDRTENSRP
jgi:hypothetical protein